MPGKKIKGKKTWIKLYPIQCIHGSIRWDLEPDERGVWYDLLNLAALMPYPGTFSDSDMRPIVTKHIAHQLHISEELLERTLDKCIKEGRITRNDTGLLHITNWDVYQKKYIEETEPDKVSLLCSKCGWSVLVGRATPWKNCRICGSELETKQID